MAVLSAQQHSIAHTRGTSSDDPAVSILFQEVISPLLPNLSFAIVPLVF